MSHWILRASFIVAAEALIFTASAAEEGAGPKPEAAAKKLVIAYKPPKTGAPDLRVGSGTRGNAADDLVLTVITPPHAGQTLEAQPTLYWYQSKPVKVSLEFYLTDVKAMKTILERKVPGQSAAGFHAFDLSTTGVTLEAGKQFEWSVTAPGKAGDPSRDVVTTGAIVRVAPPAGLAENMASASGAQKAALLASNGIWYDAFSVVSQLIEQEPGNRQHREMRSALLRQAKLEKLAE